RACPGRPAVTKTGEISNVTSGENGSATHNGTIIVDMERHEVVDVLADRSAATTARWFKDHPNVEVVSRDRAGLYAEAARQGAPQARQVEDRFHLLQNFRETIERQLGRYEAPIP